MRFNYFLIIVVLILAGCGADRPGRGIYAVEILAKEQGVKITQKCVHSLESLGNKPACNEVSSEQAYYFKVADSYPTKEGSLLINVTRYEFERYEVGDMYMLTQQ